MAPILVIVMRLAVPFSILKWPFWGAIFSILADAADIILLDRLGWGFFEGKDYHAIDKFFDIYYLAFVAYVSLRWQDVLARRASIVLFSWRLAGFIIFEITKIRQIFFFAPNIFENFYLLVAGLRQFRPSFKVNSLWKLALIIFVAAIPKIIQEYIMHFLEFPTWQFIKFNIFGWR